MFFKNIYVFAFTKEFTTTLAEMNNALSKNAFTPCAPTEIRHFGWVNYAGKSGSLGGSLPLCAELSGNVLICARSEDKILPTPVVNDLFNEKVDSLEFEYSRIATKKEREQIKEDVIFELLPRAFPRVTDTHGYINADENVIVINASSRTKAEDFLALLRKSLGTLPVTAMTPYIAPDEMMTDWVSCEIENNQSFVTNKFSIGMEAHFDSLGDNSAKAVVKNQDLSSDEVKAHLDADKYVTKLSLDFNDEMSFVLCDDLSFKKIRFFDVITEQNDDIDSDDKLAKFNDDFSLMSNVINEMIYNLHAEFSIETNDYVEE